MNSPVDNTMAAVLARMTALDGLPFSVFCTSEDLRKSMKARGFDLPKSANSIRKLVVDYSTEIQAAAIREIKELKKKGHRSSLTFDEWTSTRNRRYLNINVHFSSRVWSLGLVRVHGSLPAEKCVELIEEKLENFDLCLDKDVVSITTDGAAVMKKVGKLIEPEQQLCLAHAIQLAVIKVLYKKAPLVELIEQDDSELNDDNDDNDDNDPDDDLEFEDIYGFNIDSTDAPDENSNELQIPTILPLITKIRVVVRLFRKSPTKNDDILQKYVKLEFNKDYSLLLDSKTRWNSLLTMLERFDKLKSCVQKSLIDLSSPISFSDHELTLLSDTISALLPVKLAVEALCRADANLLTADAALNFMLTTLNNVNTILSDDLKNALEVRIMERRTNWSSVIQFLHNGYLTNDNRSDVVFKKLGQNCHLSSFS